MEAQQERTWIGRELHDDICQRIALMTVEPAGGLTIFLEELPREGVHLERKYRYTRGPDGSAYVWVGRRRTTGRGEGRSGLQFDYLEF
jgi:hypothetical protein